MFKIFHAFNWFYVWAKFIADITEERNYMDAKKKRTRVHNKQWIR